MSWNLNCQYACLEIKSASEQSDLKQLLREFAKIIWEEYATTSKDPEEDFEFYFLNYDLPDSFEDAQDLILNELLKYTTDLEFKKGYASLVVQSVCEEENNDTNLCEALIKFLFSKSGASHFLMRSAAFDKCGGYSHQWIGYWKDGEVVLEHTDDYFERIFQQSPAPVLTAS